MVDFFPPYGILADHYADTIDKKNLAPFKWIAADADRENDYSLWKADLLAQISKTLWPLWSREDVSWIDPNHQHMLALTKADFGLMEKLGGQKVLFQKPNVPLPSSQIPSHFDYFKEEDETGMGNWFIPYCVEFDESDQSNVNKANQTIRSYYGSISIQFKTEIQRPRAYQISLMMGRDFSMKLAKSASTSSMSSGHCFQGFILGCLIYDRWLQKNKRASKEELIALKQFTVDIGDRRVYAGVHYPSDNLASWLMALKLIPKIFENPLIGEFAVRAIAERSLVWKCIKDSNELAYQPAVKNLEKSMLETVQANFSWAPYNTSNT